MKKKIPVWVRGIWIINILAVGGLIVYFFFLRQDSAQSPQPQLAAVIQDEMPPPTTSRTAAPTQILPPTRDILPSVTPNPRSTLVIGKTPTPPGISLEALQQRATLIGYSVLGRPIKVYRFGNGLHKYLIVAGIHGGNEWNTVELAKELISHLDEHPEIIPVDATLYILPNLNPDGYERFWGYAGRANANGVDLNRNFPYQWKKDWEREDCWNHFHLTGGAYPASEPETVALINFIELQHFEALISYHSAAMKIFAGGIPPFEPSQDLAATLSLASHAYQYKPDEEAVCDYSGNLADWASSAKGIPAVDIELINHNDTDFKINLGILKALLNWRP